MNEGKIKPSAIHLTYELWQEMKDHAASSEDEEVCGLIAGRKNRSVFLAECTFPVTNILHDRMKFRMAPEEQLKAMLLIEQRGLDLVAIYHSHPDGPSEPSEKDINEAAYPETVQLIWAKDSGCWTCRAFLIRQGKFDRIDLQVSPRD